MLEHLESHRRLRSIPESRGGRARQEKALDRTLAATTRFSESPARSSSSAELSTSSRETCQPFIAIYAAAPGQPQNDFFATADQALFAANGGSINSWIAPAGGNVSERMVQEKDPSKAAVDLYMTILSRPPTPEESADVVRVLPPEAKEKPAAVQELVWGLLTLGRVPIQSLILTPFWPPEEVLHEVHILLRLSGTQRSRRRRFLAGMAATAAWAVQSEAWASSHARWRPRSFRRTRSGSSSSTCTAA